MSAAEVLSPAASPSSGGGRSSGSSTGITVGSLCRLHLPKRHMLVGHKPCLPSGDSLPFYHQLPLSSKLPIYRVPQGAIELTSNRLAKPTYINRQKVVFDLTDPNNYCISTHYNSLNDPHLKYYFSSKKRQQRLRENGELTPSNKVTCSVKEFNQYRIWLRHVGMLEAYRKQEEEREKEEGMKSLACESTMDIVAVENTLHHELVRQRQAQNHEAKQVRRRTQLFEMDRRMEVTQQVREDLRSQSNMAIQEKRIHRKMVYDNAVKLWQLASRQKYRRYKRRMKRHDDYLKQLVCTKKEDDDRRTREDWERRKAYQQLLEEELRNAYQQEEDRANRYRKLFMAEMHKRWQAQYDGIHARATTTKDNQQNKERRKSEYLANAFATSPLINPNSPRSAPAQNEEQDSSQVCESETDQKGSPEQDQQGDCLEMPEQDFCQSSQQSTPRVASATARASSDQGTRLPSITTLFVDSSEERKDGHTHALAVDTPLQELGLNIRLHPLNGKRSTEELDKMQKVMSRIYRQISGRSVCYMPGMKRPRKGAAMSPMVAITYGSSTEASDSSTESKADECVLAWQALSERERRDLEEVLHFLLSDLDGGRLEQEDLIRLAACCAFLNQAAERATSTTSLAATKGSETGVEEAGSRSALDGSMSSGTLDRFIQQTMEHAMEEEERQQDNYCDEVVDQSIRSNVCKLTSQLREGTLSRSEVREIGSRVASAVMGRVATDLSVMAEEEVVVPMLQQLLREVGSIDEGVLDHTLAALLLSYNQVTRDLDKVVWQVIKDFAVDVLLRTKVALVHGDLDSEQFLDNLKSCQTSPLHQEMELPRPDELIYVLSTGVQKLQGVEEMCPVLCDLMKIVLDIGKPLLIQRDGIDVVSIPDINSESLLTIGQTACGLEVALEVTATVADGLFRDMQMDGQFEELIRLSMAPPFFLAVLASWGEMSAAIPRGTVALQTTSGELPYAPSLGEYVVLVACCGLFNDALQDRLPRGLIAQLALHVAEFPGLVSLPSLTDPNHKKPVKLPPYVMRKMASLSTLLQERELGMEEMKKILAILLHIYLREVLMPQGQEDLVSSGSLLDHLPEQQDQLLQDLWEQQQQQQHQQREEEAVVADVRETEVELEDEEEAREAVTTLVRTLASLLMGNTQEEVAKTLEVSAAPSSLDTDGVWEAVQLLAERGRRELQGQVRKGLTAEHLQDPQLHSLLTAATLQERSCQHLQQHTAANVASFMKQVTRGAQKVGPVPSGRKDQGEQLLAAQPELDKQLGTLAHDVIKLFSGMGMLHQSAVQRAPAGNKTVTFLVTLLQGLRQALQDGLLATDVVCQFLRAVGREMCVCGAEEDQARLVEVLRQMANDIEWKGSRSRFFHRLVANLSQLSLDPIQQTPEVVEGMATTAHMLSSVSPAILNQFVQTTLLSLLHAMRGSHTHLRPASPFQPTIITDEATQQDLPEAEDVPDLTNNHTPPEGTAHSRKSSQLHRASPDEAPVSAHAAPAAVPVPEGWGKEALAAAAAASAAAAAKDMADHCQNAGGTSPPEDAQFKAAGQTTGTTSTVAAENSKARTEDGGRLADSETAAPANKSSLPGTSQTYVQRFQRRSFSAQPNISGNEFSTLDSDTLAEIRRQTESITHHALQKTLERLNATLECQDSVAPALSDRFDGLFAGPSRDHITQIVDNIIKDFKGARVPKRDFPDVHPAMKPYAYHLMQYITQSLSSGEETGISMEKKSGFKLKPEDMAAVVIKNLLKSWQEADTLTCKSQCDTDAEPDREQKRSRMPSVDMSALNECLASMLMAVQTELEQRPARSSASKQSQRAGKSSAPDDAWFTMITQQVIAFILRKVKRTPWELRPDYYSERRNTGTVPSETDISTSRRESIQSSLLSDIILQTLRDVLHEMQVQNQFFSHTELGKMLPEPHSPVFLPSLPFQLDNYILCRLHQMAMLLTRHVPGMESPNRLLSGDAYSLATTFHAILKESLHSEKSKQEEDSDEAETGGKKVFVLTVLDKAVTRILEDSMYMTMDMMNPIEESEEAGSRKTSSDQTVNNLNRTNVEVKNDLKKLFVSLRNMKSVMKGRTSSTDILEAEQETVCKAIEQIIASLLDDKIVDDVLDDLCKTLLVRTLEDESRESKRSGLLIELQSLLSMVQSGQISRTKLTQAAADMTLLEQHHAEDPRQVAGALQRVSSSLRVSSTHYLRMALEDLLYSLGAGSSRSSTALPLQDVFDSCESSALGAGFLGFETGEMGPRQPGSSGSKDSRTPVKEASEQEHNLGHGGQSPFETKTEAVGAVLYQDPMEDSERELPFEGNVSGNRNDEDTPGAEGNPSDSGHDRPSTPDLLPTVCSSRENLNEEQTQSRPKAKVSLEETVSDSAMAVGLCKRGRVSQSSYPDDDDELGLSYSCPNVCPQPAPDQGPKTSVVKGRRISAGASANLSRSGCSAKGTKAEAGAIKEDLGSSSDSRKGGGGSASPRCPQSPHANRNCSARGVRSEHYVSCEEYFPEADPPAVHTSDVAQGGEADTEYFTPLTKAKLPSATSKKPPNPSTYSRKLLSKSQAFAVATYTENMTGQKRKPKQPKKIRSKLSPSLQAEQYCPLSSLHQDPTTAVQEYGDRPHALVAGDSELAGPARERAAPATMHSGQAEVQPENASVRKQRQVLNPHPQQVYRKEGTRNRTDSSPDKQKAGKQAPKVRTLKTSSLTHDVSPSRERTSHCKGLQKEGQLLRAQMKAFALGCSLFNAKGKEQIIHGQKKKTTQQLYQMTHSVQDDTSVSHESAQSRRPARRRVRSDVCRESDVYSLDQPSSSRVARRSPKAASQSSFVPHPPERRATELKTGTVSRRTKTGRKRQPGPEAAGEASDTQVYPVLSWEESVPGGKTRNAPRAHDTASSAQTQEQPEGRFLRKLMEWSSDSDSYSTATQTSDLTLNTAVKTPEKLERPSLISTDSEQLFERTQKKVDDWVEKGTEIPRYFSEAPSTSTTLLPLRRSSQQRPMSDARRKHPTSAKLPALPHSGSKPLEARTPPCMQRTAGEVSRVNSSNPNLAPKLKKRVQRHQRDQQNNALVEGRGPVSPYAQACSAFQSPQTNLDGPFLMPRAPDTDRQHPVSARRRVRPHLAYSLQIPGVPRPVLPRPPDTKR